MNTQQQAKPTLSPILAAIMMNVDNKELGLTNPANWTLDAILAVEYSLHDRQFPQVDHGTTVVHFASDDEYEAWRAEKQEWIRGTDYDFSLDGLLYRWDLGPQLVGSINL